ncbi:MAG: hypothetical protein MUE55_05795 [Thermoplasmata archaeon]|jgi:hypothetical protein|nr:hypothetical protein [Thermoplasmata archaeon]
MLVRSEVERVVEDSYHKLYQIAAPPVRVYLLEEVMQKGREDAVVKAVLRDVERYPPRVKLLSTIRKDGTWPIPKQRKLAEEAGPGPPHGWTYVTMLRNLFDLSEWCTTIDDGRIRLVLERILSWQQDDGHIPGPWTDLFPLPHYNGFALRGLTIFKLGDDPRVSRLADWLIRMQRPDGGWVIPFQEDVKYLPEYRNLGMSDFMEMLRGMDRSEYDPRDYGDVPSCIWTTAMVVRGFAQRMPMLHHSEAMRGADFLLGMFFRKNYHPTFYHSEKNWTTLKYPTYFGSGLCVLDILTWLGYGADDARLEKPMEWLMGLRSKDGFWRQTGRPNPVKDNWITAIAVVTLARYARGL